MTYSRTMATALAVIALVLAACHGPRRWTTADVVMESTFAAATAVDGLESVSIVRQCREQNPIIGRCGGTVPLAVYIPVSELVHLAISWAIPHGTARTVWLGVSDGAELDTIYSNEFDALGH